MKYNFIADFLAKFSNLTPVIQFEVSLLTALLYNHRQNLFDQGRSAAPIEHALNLDRETDSFYYSP